MTIITIRFVEIIVIELHQNTLILDSDIYYVRMHSQFVCHTRPSLTCLMWHKNCLCILHPDISVQYKYYMIEWLIWK